MNPNDRPCELYGSGVGEHLNTFVADVFGISTIDEDGIPRTLGCCTDPSKPAVFWYVAISHHTAAHVSFWSQYECIELYSYRRSTGNRCYVAYIVHARPVNELHRCELVQPPELHLSLEGIDFAIERSLRHIGWYQDDDCVTIECTGWRPFYIP